MPYTREYLETIKLEDLSSEMILELLDESYGSGNDPIMYRGKETTPNDIRFGGHIPAVVRIGYWAFDSKGNLIFKNGTLLGMLKDRMIPSWKYNKPPKHKHKYVCQCGKVNK